VITRLSSVFLALILFAAAPAFSQTPSGSDDDGALQPAEPDYRVINLPTTLRLPVYKSSFELTHRFNGNLRRGDFGDQASSLFGIDQGATIGFEYRFAPVRHVQFIAYRENYDKTIQLTGKWDAIHQNADRPVSVSGLLSVDGGNNFRERYAPSVGAAISRQIDDRAAVYLVPMWVHNVTPLAAQITGIKDNNFYLGIGAGFASGRPSTSRLKCRRASRASPRHGRCGFAIESAPAHHLQLNSRTASSRRSPRPEGGLPDSLFLGFNSPASLPITVHQ
jgi:hypothetical protein